MASCFMTIIFGGPPAARPGRQAPLWAAALAFFRALLSPRVTRDWSWRQLFSAGAQPAAPGAARNARRAGPSGCGRAVSGPHRPGSTSPRQAWPAAAAGGWWPDSSYVPHRKSVESVDAVGAVVRDPVLLFARQAVAFELE